MTSVSFGVEVSRRALPRTPDNRWNTVSSQRFETLAGARDKARKASVLELEHITDALGTKHDYTYGPYLEEIPLGEYSRTRGYQVSAHSELRATVFSFIIIHETDKAPQ